MVPILVNVLHERLGVERGFTSIGKGKLHLLRKRKKGCFKELAVHNPFGLMM